MDDAFDFPMIVWIDSGGPSPTGKEILIGVLIVIIIITAIVFWA